MEKPEIKITRDFLLRVALGKIFIEDFDKVAPTGACDLSELLKTCETAELFSFAGFLIDWFPENPELLVIEEYDGGNIYYNGDVHIKKGFKCSGNIICKRLTVDGKLVVGGRYYVQVISVEADEIELIGGFCILEGDASTYKFVTDSMSNLIGSLEIK